MRALVLSAGGMFGAWQAGAWKAIASCFEPELVVGASVGSLNGWAIASGCSPEDLVAEWQRAGGNPRRLIDRLAATYRPRIPFSAVVTDIAARRAFAISRGQRCCEKITRPPCPIPALRF